MIVYVDISKQCIIKTDDEDRTVFKGDENVDHIKVYFAEYPKQWYLTLGALLPNGRTIPQRFHDGEVLSDEIDDTTYYYVEFTLSKENGFTLMNGKTIFTLKIHYTNDAGAVAGEKTIGAIAVNIVDSTTEDENILILDGNTAEVVYNMKLAIENMQARLTNFENKITTNELIVNTIATITKAVITTLTVDSIGAKNIISEYITATTKMTTELLNANNVKIDNDLTTDILNVITTADIANAIIKTLEVRNESTFYGNVEIGDGVTNPNLDVHGTFTADKGVRVKNTIGILNDSINGILFKPDGSLTLKNTAPLVLQLLINAASFETRNFTFPDKNGSIMLEDDIKAELLKKVSVALFTAFKNEMEAKHDEMVAEHNAQAQNLQKQIDTINQVLESDDLSLDTFREIGNVLKEAGADIEAIFTQLGLKANTTYVDEQNALDQAYTDSRVNSAISEFNDTMQAHKLEVQDQVNTYTNTTKEYVDNSVGDIPAILDYLIEVSA